MANITTQTIRVDLSTDKVIPSAFTHQNDTARTLVFDMYNSGMPYTMTGNTVKFAYKSPIVNGQYSVIAGASMASGTVSGNKVTVTLPVAYTQISGVGMLTMIITPTSGTVRPVNIRLVVQKSADGANEIAGASDFPATLDEIAENWLDENISIQIDDTLSVSGKAADAKVTGDEIRNLKSDLNLLTDSSVITVYNRTGDITQLGNINNWRWFYPVEIYPGEILNSIKFYAIPSTARDTNVFVEVWENNGVSLERIEVINITIEANSGNRFITVPLNLKENSTLIVSLTGDANNVGGVVSTGTEREYYSTNKTDTTLSISNINKYVNASLAGEVSVIKYNDIDSVNNYSISTESPSKLGNISNWRWFYPVTIETGNIVENISFYAMPDTAEKGIKIEIWKKTGTQLNKYKEIGILAPHSNELITVPVLLRATQPLMISFTGTGNVIGAKLSQGTELAYNSHDKTSDTIDLSTLNTYYNASIIGSISVIPSTKSDVFNKEVITVSANNFSFKDAVSYANTSEADEVEIRVKPGTYNLISEYGETFLNENDIEGPTIERDMKIIFDSGAKVTANYTGSNVFINEHFSILNTHKHSCKIVNADLEASNIRYCIHDEHGADEIPYMSEYENCKMKIDNTNNPVFQIANCLGVGLGKNADFRIYGGYYESYRFNDSGVITDNTDIRIHNSSNSNAESKVTIDRVYCRKGVGVFSYGNSTKMTNFYISNCSFLRDIYEGYSTGATIDNVNVVKWNNEIRT